MANTSTTPVVVRNPNGSVSITYSPNDMTRRPELRGQTVTYVNTNPSNPYKGQAGYVETKTELTTPFDTGLSNPITVPNYSPTPATLTVAPKVAGVSKDAQTAIATQNAISSDLPKLQYTQPAPGLIRTLQQNEQARYDNATPQQRFGYNVLSAATSPVWGTAAFIEEAPAQVNYIARSTGTTLPEAAAAYTLKNFVAAPVAFVEGLPQAIAHDPAAAAGQLLGTAVGFAAIGGAIKSFTKPSPTDVMVTKPSPTFSTVFDSKIFAKDGNSDFFGGGKGNMIVGDVVTKEPITYYNLEGFTKGKVTGETAGVTSGTSKALVKAYPTAKAIYDTKAESYKFTDMTNQPPIKSGVQGVFNTHEIPLIKNDLAIARTNDLFTGKSITNNRGAITTDSIISQGQSAKLLEVTNPKATIKNAQSFVGNSQTDSLITQGYGKTTTNVFTLEGEQKPIEPFVRATRQPVTAAAVRVDMSVGAASRITTDAAIKTVGKAASTQNIVTGIRGSVGTLSGIEQALTGGMAAIKPQKGSQLSRITPSTPIYFSGQKQKASPASALALSMRVSGYTQAAVGGQAQLQKLKIKQMNRQQPSPATFTGTTQGSSRMSGLASVIAQGQVQQREQITKQKQGLQMNQMNSLLATGKSGNRMAGGFSGFHYAISQHKPEGLAKIIHGGSYSAKAPQVRNIFLTGRYSGLADVVYSSASGFRNVRPVAAFFTGRSRPRKFPKPKRLF